LFALIHLASGHIPRGGAVAARVAHNHEVPGSSPGPATKSTTLGRFRTVLFYLILFLLYITSMKACETHCQLYADCNPEANAAVGNSPAIVEVQGRIHAGLEGRIAECVGWSSLRYLYRSIGGEGGAHNVARPHEDPCNNPYRATDEYWDNRIDLINTMRAESGEPPLDENNKDEGMGLLMEDMTRFHTARRINKQQRLKA
jgi:hypothetical protein